MHDGRLRTHPPVCPPFLFPPAPPEAGALQPGTHVGIPLHHGPDELAAIVLDHGHDRSLVDPQVFGVHPPDAAHAFAMPGGNVIVEARVEGVREAVLAVDITTVALVHFL